MHSVTQECNIFYEMLGILKRNVIAMRETLFHLFSSGKSPQNDMRMGTFNFESLDKK